MVPNNPKVLLDALHYERAVKTPYELACMFAEMFLLRMTMEL